MTNPQELLDKHAQNFLNDRATELQSVEGLGEIAKRFAAAFISFQTGQSEIEIRADNKNEEMPVDSLWYKLAEIAVKVTTKTSTPPQDAVFITKNSPLDLNGSSV